jgi:aspartate carbamoyltransferase catalytic subunit
MNLKSKDLLGLRDLSADEIEFILETAKTMKLILTTKNKRTPHIRFLSSRKYTFLLKPDVLC